jgi:hypothetical protein
LSALATKADVQSVFGLLKLSSLIIHDIALSRIEFAWPGCVASYHYWSLIGKSRYQTYLAAMVTSTAVKTTSTAVCSHKLSVKGSLKICTFIAVTPLPG